MTQFRDWVKVYAGKKEGVFKKFSEASSAVELVTEVTCITFPWLLSQQTVL